MLGRVIDPAGLNNGMISLANSGSLQQLRQGIAGSAEEAGDLSAMVSAATGGGSASPALLAALQYWLSVSWTLPQAQSWLTGECGAIGHYDAVLGRAADPAGMANVLNQIVYGASMATIQSQLAGSAEAAGVVGSRHTTGRIARFISQPPDWKSNFRVRSLIDIGFGR